MQGKLVREAAEALSSTWLPEENYISFRNDLWQALALCSQLAMALAPQQGAGAGSVDARWAASLGLQGTRHTVRQPAALILGGSRRVGSRGVCCGTEEVGQLGNLQGNLQGH